MIRHRATAPLAAFLAGAVVAILMLTAASALPAVEQVLPLPLPLFDPGAEILAQENTLRQAQGLPKLTRNVNLETAARNYAIQMSYGHFFEHTTPSGVTFEMRIRDVGYTRWNWLGEVLSAGRGTSSATIAAWLGSPEHRVIVLDPRAHEEGVGYADVPGADYRPVWVEELGARFPDLPLSVDAVAGIVQQAARAYGVDPVFLVGVAACESSLDPTKIGDHGHSRGLVQISDSGSLPDFLAQGNTDPFDPVQSARYLAKEISAGHGGRWSCWWVLQNERPPWWH